MSAATTYTVNLDGNAIDVLEGISRAVGKINDKLDGLKPSFKSIEGRIVAFSQLTDIARDVDDALSSAIEPGIQLNSALADLSAISGVSGKGLKQIESYARQTAKTFGGSAADSVESYKLLLSQLTPELAKSPAAMQKMGNHIATLSKTMKGDTTAAAEVLTTAMNQYQVSTEDPIAASAKMGEMMNIMAAAAKAGSAELPSIKSALEQCGMTAKSFNVSFAETNASIQLLDKSGKKGSEGGIALRNVMSTLSQGRFLPKDVQAELAAAGINIDTLSDKSLSLTERLSPLNNIMSDSALMSKMFGRENSAAALALISGAEQINTWTTAIQGTNTAYDQAGIIMESYEEKQARIQARFDDIKVSIFNATGDLGLWVSTLSSSMVTISQLLPLIDALGKAMIKLSGKWGVFVKYFRIGALNVMLRLGILKYAVNSAGGVFKYFSKIGIAACRSLGTAIMNIPVIGWLIAIIAGIIVLFKVLWDNFENFRIICFIALEVFKSLFASLWESIKSLFSVVGDFFTSIWDSIKSLFVQIGSFFGEIWVGIINVTNMIYQPFLNLYIWVKNLFSSMLQWVTSIFKEALGWIENKIKKIVNAVKNLLPKGAVEKGVEAGRKSWAEDHPEKKEPTIPDDIDLDDNNIAPDGGGDGTTPTVSPPPVTNKANVNAAVSGGSQSKVININLGKLVENIVFQGSLSENRESMTKQVEDALVRVLYSAQTAL